MAILKFTKFKKERAALREQKIKEAAHKKYTEKFNEKLAEFGVSNPSELTSEDQVKFYDSLKPVMEAAEKANASGKDVATPPADGQENIDDNADKDGKEEINDDKGSAKVVAENDDKGSAKDVAKDVDGGDIEEKTKAQKEKAGESGQAKEDQEGDELTPTKKEGDTPAKKETVNASGKVVEMLEEGMLAPKAAKKLSIGDTIKTDKHTYKITGYGNKANAFRQFEVEDENGERYNIQVSLRGSTGIRVAKGRSLNFPEQEEMLESVEVTETEKSIDEQIEEAKAALAALEEAKKTEESSCGTGEEEEEEEQEELNEEEIKDEASFRKYAEELLKKAHGDKYDEAQGKKVIDGLIAKYKDDFGAMVGAVQASLD